MKCRHFFSFALVAFLSFFFGSFITTNNTFALNDVVYTSSYGEPQFYICGGDSSVVCSDYSYIIFEPVGSSGYQAMSFLGTNIRIPAFTSSIISIPSSLTSLSFQAGTNLTSITITLTNSLPSSSSPPSGDLSITSNGTYDVSSYATATVDVPAEVIQGDYHDDLVNIQNSIITCGAILLVLYFFYCIYRLIIKNSGVH